MKHKKRTVCHTCRRRKLGCDGRQPSCSQCSISGLTCDGYSTEWTFIQQGSFNASNDGNSSNFSNTPRLQQIICQENHSHSLRSVGEHRSSGIELSLRPEMSIVPALDHLVGVIVEKYLPASERSTSALFAGHKHPRICGTWVEVLYELPWLFHSNSVLSKSVNALAAAVLASNIPHRGYSEPYLIAIRNLRQTLATGGGSTHELIPAVMCLILVEVMIPNATVALGAHLKAVGAFFNSCGPIACKTGLLHKLFVGFRPLMIIYAIQNRQPTFLGLPFWNLIPFSQIRPSIMQIFLGDFVHLASLLHGIDGLFVSETCRPSQAEIEDHLSLLTETSTRLNGWEGSLTSSSQSYWRCHNQSGHQNDAHESAHGDDDEDDYRPIYYPSVTMANIFILLWAFQIIVIRDMGRLTIALSEWRSDTSISMNILHAEKEPNNQVIVSLSRKIFLSMDYLLQEDMGLFGPASSSFPLQVSWDVVKEGGNEFDRSYIEWIVERLMRRGLLSAPTLIFGHVTRNY